MHILFTRVVNEWEVFDALFSMMVYFNSSHSHCASSYPTVAAPLTLCTRDERVNHDLCAVEEVAKLRLPHAQTIGRIEREAA